MKLQELIDRLNELADEADSEGMDPSEIEVLLAFQPEYPLTHTVANVVPGWYINEGRDRHRRLREGQAEAIWIAGSQVRDDAHFGPYAPGEAWDAR